jgi:putative ABC transport system permease protein
MDVLRNLSRRKLRSALTISGIVIGIFALTTMGAMAARFNQELNGGVTYFGSNIQVGAPAGQLTALIPSTKLTDVRAVPGVVAAYPNYSLPLTPGAGFSFGEVPESLVNRSPAETAHVRPATPLASGHDIAGDTRGAVVIGSVLARKYQWRIGEEIDLPRRPSDAGPNFVTHPFTVIGILQPTDTAPDDYVYVSTADAQMLLVDSLPAQVRKAIDPSRFLPGVIAFGTPRDSITQLDHIADRINAMVSGVKATRPSTPVDSFRSFASLFTTITTGAGLIALVVGGLSVVNTMAMAVSERVREIGVRRAIGARTTDILREFMSEAAAIGLAGGGVGYLVALLLTGWLNASATGAPLFAITPQLTLLVIGFAVLLACLAGVLPAIRAARLDPVIALRTVS